MLWKTIGKEGGGKLSARLKEKMCVCACDELVMIKGGEGEGDE